MARITLNGFIPGNGKNPREDINSTLVAVFLSRKYNTKDAELLFEASPDENGSIIKDISDDYIGEDITIVFIDLKFSEQKIEKKISELGVFHSFNLEKDYCYNHSIEARNNLDKINTDKIHSDAQDDMINHIRDSKYNNKFIKIVGNILTFGSPLIGLAVAAIPGVVVGIFVSIIVYIFTPYINGNKKWQTSNKTE